MWDRFSERHVINLGDHFSGWITVNPLKIESACNELLRADWPIECKRNFGACMLCPGTLHCAYKSKLNRHRRQMGWLPKNLIECHNENGMLKHLMYFRADLLRTRPNEIKFDCTTVRNFFNDIHHHSVLHLGYCENIAMDFGWRRLQFRCSSGLLFTNQESLLMAFLAFNWNALWCRESDCNFAAETQFAFAVRRSGFRDGQHDARCVSPVRANTSNKSVHTVCLCVVNATERLGENTVINIGWLPFQSSYFMRRKLSFGWQFLVLPFIQPFHHRWCNVRTT